MNVRIILLRIAVAAGMMASGPSNASGIGLEVNVAHTPDRTGGEFEIGSGFSLGRLDLNSVVGAFVFKGNDNGYFETTDRSNVTRCRAPNGRFAKDSQCNSIAAKAYARAEVGVKF